MAMISKGRDEHRESTQSKGEAKHSGDGQRHGTAEQGREGQRRISESQGKELQRQSKYNFNLFNERLDMKIKITFTEPLLGTLAGTKEIAAEFIASKHPDGTRPDEAETIQNMDEQLEKSSTIFPKDEKGIFLWDYQVKGFIKDAMLSKITCGEYTQEKLKKVRLTMYSYKKTVDQHIFVSPRKIYLNTPSETYFTERPLRAETMRGERIALARSETAPIGTTCEIEIISCNDKLWDYIIPCLDYGKLRGIGQWRNSGMGRFSYEDLQ